MPSPVLSMRQLARPLFGMWVCPHFFAFGIPGDGSKPAQINARPTIKILNPNAVSLTVIVNMFDGKGQYLPDLSGKLTVPSRHIGEHTPKVIGVKVTGWVTVSSTKPIYPSGEQTRSEKSNILGELSAEANAVLYQTHRTPLQFYPVFVPEVDVKGAWNQDD